MRSPPSVPPGQLRCPSRPGTVETAMIPPSSLVAWFIIIFFAIIIAVAALHVVVVLLALGSARFAVFLTAVGRGGV